jgi:hypothetical protein
MEVFALQYHFPVILEEELVVNRKRFFCFRPVRFSKPDRSQWRTFISFKPYSNA